MANVLANKHQINDENKCNKDNHRCFEIVINDGLVVPARSKQAFARTHSIKKQIFGELKNVIHNQQGGITPFKGIYAGAGAFSVSKGSVKVDRRTKVDVTSDALTLTSSFDDFVECFDFPKVCCTKTCFDGDWKTWSDIFHFDDSIWKTVMEKAFSEGDKQFDYAAEKVFADDEAVDDFFLESIPSHVQYNWDDSEEDEELTLAFDFPKSIEFSNNAFP